MGARRHEAGFALVEVLVGLSVASLVIGLLAVVFSSGQGLSSRIQGDLDRVEEVALLHRLMAEALSETAARPDVPRFAGGMDWLSVLTVPPSVLSFLDAPAQLAIGPDRDGGLRASWTSVSGGGEGIAHQILSADRRARFSYLAPGGPWSSVWNDARRVPSLVRLEILSGPDELEETFLMPVRSVRSSDCAIAPLARGCGAAL